MTTIEMRERSTGEIIDGAFTLLREHFGLLFGIAVVTQGIPVVFNVYLQFLPTGAMVQQWWLWFVSAALAGFGGLIAAAAILYTVSEAYLGGEPEFGAAMRFAVSRMWPLFIAGLAKYLILMLIMMVGPIVAAIIPLLGGLLALASVPVVIIVACGYGLVSQAVVLESPQRPTDALSRSWDLTSDYKGRVFVLGVVTYLLAYLPSLGIQFVAGMVGVWSPTLMAPLTVLGALAVLPLFPVIGCAFTLLYYDLRQRKEAFDLEFLTNQFEIVTAAR